MVAEALVEADVEAGAELIRRLDETDFGVHSALWLFLDEREEWQLVIATPRYPDDGPRECYRRVQEVLRKSQPPLGLSLGQIGLVSPQDPLIRLLPQAVGQHGGISRIRFSRNIINGVYIEDALIYRLQ